jgi:hypothetical protein
VRDRWVHFRIADVEYPEFATVLRELHSEDWLRGKVLEVSDSGHEACAFVVVEVEGLARPLVVPVARVKELQ